MHKLMKANMLKFYYAWPCLAPSKRQPALLSETSIAKAYTFVL